MGRAGNPRSRFCRSSLYGGALIASSCLGLALTQCGGDDAAAPNTSDASAQSDGPTQDGATPGPSSDGGDGGTGPSSAACSIDALATPKTAKSYFVAANEPGSDDVLCDGLAATNEGSGRCPWRSLDPVQKQNILINASNVTVALRAGNYLVKGFAGLVMQGVGKSDAERVVLTRYRDEAVVLDVGSPNGAACPLEAGVEPPPECVRQVVRMAGEYVTVQGLTIRNGLGFQLEVNGGAHHVVRCNKLEETVEFTQRSDQLKLDGHATDVHIEHNEFTKWRSQAIDITEVDHVFIEENEFHHPHDKGCGATGGKKGSHHIFIQRNVIHDIATTECLDPSAYVAVGGGTGFNGTHPESYEAEEMHIVDNKIRSVAGKLFRFTSCKNCSFERNDVTNVAAGIVIDASGNGFQDCVPPGGSVGCLPSTGLVVAGNRMKGLDGRGNPAQANVFMAFEKSAGSFTSGTNVYCASPTAADAKFIWEGASLSFADWKTASGTDGTSTLLAATDPACLAW